VEKHLDPKVVLLAAQMIRQKGREDQGRYVYQQLVLETSYDGYTLCISDSKVRLWVYFHNTLKADYGRAQELDDFYERLCQFAQRG